ncbi:MAG: hypothetical protein GXY83_09535 [Rhodopirellula sp.]|nr:hypothetical protein [Rhodopirellula sp.]
MSAEPAETEPSSAPRTRPRQWRLAVQIVVGLLVVYVVLAYLVVPLAWKRHERRHPWLDDVRGITQTADGIPGDPLNVSLIGTEAELKGLMTDAGWYPANPLGLRSDLKIAADTVLERPYDEAPVSNLYLFGRKEDLAFEQPVGDDPRRRHHVRYWRTSEKEPSGRPAWIGSITYDQRVGFSHTTGQITHHIGPDVDAERDRIFEQLEKTGRLDRVEIVDDFHEIREGRNGGGDPWYTDGRLFVGTIKITLIGDLHHE